MREALDGLVLRTLSWADGLWPAPPSASPSAPAGSVDALAPGSVVANRYRLEDVLGEGGFGRVWRARDLSAERDVAFKEMRRPATADDEGASTAQLEQEFYSLSKLQHPNIVRVFDYGELDDGTRYLVMELVPGYDVYEKVKRGPLERDSVFRVLIDMCQALHLMHSRLFVHCDIKAENIRVTSKGAKLMDFGLLHQLGTPATEARGTPQYMAPEMIQGGVIDGRTDLYSLGALAYEMFSGRLPFEGATPLEVMQQHLGERPREPSYYLDLPDGVDELVLRLLAKDPKERFKSAADVLASLTSLSGIDAEDLPVTHRTSYLYSANLVGRERESAELRSLRELLQEGKGGALFLSGRGGEGKTRLLEELRLGIKLDRIPWASSVCRREGLAPLQPMVEVLELLAARTSDPILAPHGAVLSHILPSLRGRGFSPPPFASPTTAKFRVNEAAAAWLKDLAAERPLCLALEDLHAADGATLDLFNHLIRELKGSAVLLLGTFRSTEVDRTSPLYATVSEGAARCLELSPLSRAAVDELLASTLTEHALSNDFIDVMFERTGGNAFFVIEMLRYLVEAGHLAEHEGRFAMTAEAVELPGEIGAIVEKRLLALPDELADFCRAVAPIGRALSAKLVEELTASSRESVQERFEQLVERQFLSRERGQFSFANDAVREGIYRNTADDERQARHLRIGELLEKGVGVPDEQPAPPNQLAYHYKRSRTPERAVDFFLAAAQLAIKKQLLLEGSQMLSEGAELLEQSSRKDKTPLLATFYDAMAAAAVGTHPPSTVKAVARLDELWQNKVDPDRVLALIKKRKERAEKAPAFLKKYFSPPPGPPPPFDPKTDDPVRIFDRQLQLHGMQAMAFAVLGQPDQAMAVADRLVARLPDPRSPLKAVAAVPRILALFHMGRFGELREVARGAMAAFEAAGDRLPPPLRIFWFLSTYVYSLSEAVDGRVLDEDVANKAKDIAERFDLPQERAFAMLPRLVRAAVSGIPSELNRWFAEMDDIIRRLGYPHALHSRFRLWLPIYYLERGELELSRATAARLEGMGKATRDVWLLTYAGIYHALDAMEAGEHERADQLLIGAIEGARARKLGRLATALCARGQLLSSVQRDAEARPLLEEALQRATSSELRCSYDESVASRLLGEVSDGEPGDNLLARALEVAADMQSPVQQGFAWYAIARRRQRLGNGDVQQAVDEAIGQFSSIDNTRWCERAKKLALVRAE